MKAIHYAGHARVSSGWKFALVAVFSVCGFGAYKAGLFDKLFQPAVVAPARVAVPRALRPGEVYTFVANQKIPAYMVRVTPSMYTKVPVKIESVEGRDVIFKESDLIGRVSLIDIEPNRELREKYFAKKTGMTGLAVGIPKDWVARTFDISDIEGLTDGLHTNDVVALLTANKDKPAEFVTEQGKVLSVSPKKTVMVPPSKKNPNPKPKTEGTVTICYPIQDSLAVADAMQEGKLQILLLSEAGAVAQFRQSAKSECFPPQSTAIQHSLEVEKITGTKRAWEKVNYAVEQQP